MDNNLRIQLSRPPNYYYTNYDNVSGLVFFNHQTTSDISAITVQLVGICKTNAASLNHANRAYFYKDEVKVFPPSDMGASGSKLALSKFGMVPGEHSFPFRFAFPGKQKYNNSKQHCYGLLRAEPAAIKNKYFYLPPSFSFTNDNGTHYASINYFIIATVKTANILKLNTDASAKVLFCPTNDFLRYSLSNISYGKWSLYPHYSNVIQWFEFTCPPEASFPSRLNTSSGSSSGLKSSLFTSTISSRRSAYGSSIATTPSLASIFPSFKQKSKKFVPSIGSAFKKTKKMLVPFAFQLNFYSYWNHACALGLSPRIVQPNVNANQFLDLSLIIPSTSFMLIQASQQQQQLFAECGDGVLTPYITVSYMRIELVTKVHFVGQTSAVVQKKETLHIGNDLDFRVSLCEFTRTQNNMSVQFPKQDMSSYGDLFGSCADDSNFVYKYKFPSLFLDFVIPEQKAPSFVTHRVKRLYSLRFVLGCFSSCNERESVNLIKETPLVLVNDENVNDVYYPTVDPLPIYCA